MAINTFATSKYGKIISESEPIKVGSPAIFQLRLKEEVVGSLRTMTFGQRTFGTHNKTILVVGETGTGKSTLINALVNYTMGVQWQDDVWFHIVQDERKHVSLQQRRWDEAPDQSQSQTADVIVYQVFGFEGGVLPFSLTIIDTPGYGDTKGIEHDDVVSSRLFEYFGSGQGVTEIHAVGLVLKASENRVNDRLRYVFDSALSLFGKNMEQNIVALMTHSTGLKPKNALKALDTAKIKCARSSTNEPVYFLFDNCQHEDRAEDPDGLQHVFNITTRGLKQFMDFLSRTAPQTMDASVDVLSERIRLTACIDNLKERVEFIEMKQVEIRQEEEILKKYEEKMRRNENFTETKDIPYKDFVSTSDKVTSCKECKENCHNPCSAAGVTCCKSIQKGHCTVCTKKCPKSNHVREAKKYVSKTRTEYVTKDAMKKKYDQYKAGTDGKTKILEDLRDKKKELETTKDLWLDEAFDHVVTLEQIALNADSLSTLTHLDFLIEKMEERGDAEKTLKLREMKERVDKGAQAGLQYRLKASAAGLRRMLRK